MNAVSNPPSSSLMSVQDLHVAYRTAAGTVQAVRGVSFSVERGETVGLVGESGCGKSSLGKAVLRLSPLAAGRVQLDGHDISTLSPRQLRPLRPLAQMVFQDPNGSLNPRHDVGSLLAQPLAVAGLPARERQARVQQLLQQVGLPPGAAARFPHEFSGGQRQRIGIARALALNPKLVVCDEPVSALDVSVRAQIINLLQDLQAELGVSYLFISHDLSVVRHLCNRVLVMYLGRFVESGSTEQLWRAPAHPYTRALLAAAPHADPRQRQRHPGAGDPAEAPAIELPNPLAPPPGCAFHGRCPHALPRCRSEAPPLRTLAGGHQVACHVELPPLAPITLHRPSSTPLHHAPSHQPG